MADEVKRGVYESREYPIPRDIGMALEAITTFSEVDREAFELAGTTGVAMVEVKVVDGKLSKRIVPESEWRS